jgi:hypothetical protein
MTITYIVHIDTFTFQGETFYYINSTYTSYTKF